MLPAEGERLIAFEAAIQELAILQGVAVRYRALRQLAEALLGDLMDLGRTLRQATRRGVFTEDVVEEAAGRVRGLRSEWNRRLLELRSSAPYKAALAAYGAEDQAELAALMPEVFAGLEPAPPTPPYYQAVALTSHRRSSGGHFRPASAVAEEIEALRREGLRPRVHGRDWWDTDFPALALAFEKDDVDGPIVLSIERIPASASLFRAGDSVSVFTSCLPAEVSVVLAETSTDTWFEAAEESYERYRDALALELRQRGVPLQFSPPWS